MVRVILLRVDKNSARLSVAEQWTFRSVGCAFEIRSGHRFS